MDIKFLPKSLKKIFFFGDWNIGGLNPNPTSLRKGVGS